MMNGGFLDGRILLQEHLSIFVEWFISLFLTFFLYLIFWDSAEVSSRIDRSLLSVADKLIC